MTVGKTTAKKILSISGSQTAPKRVTTPHLRASIPSNRSVSDEARSSASAIHRDAMCSDMFDNVTGTSMSHTVRARNAKSSGAREHVIAVTAARRRARIGSS